MDSASTDLRRTGPWISHHLHEAARSLSARYRVIASRYCEHTNFTCTYVTPFQPFFSLSSKFRTKRQFAITAWLLNLVGRYIRQGSHALPDFYYLRFCQRFFKVSLEYHLRLDSECLAFQSMPGDKQTSCKKQP